MSTRTARTVRIGPDICGLVAALCRELSLDSDDGTLFLDRDTLARCCGVSPGEASACLKALIASRVIRKIGEPSPGRATTYRYLLSWRDE